MNFSEYGYYLLDFMKVEVSINYLWFRWLIVLKFVIVFVLFFNINKFKYWDLIKLN